MRFPIKLKENTVGYITVLENNNNIIIDAECQYSSDDILRLFAKTGESIVNLGVLEPSENNTMCLKRKIKKDIINNNTIYYLDDGSGKYIILSRPYETAFNAGHEHKYPYLLTACSLEKVNSVWISYIKKVQTD